MTRVEWNPSAGEPMAPEQRPPKPVAVLAMQATTPYDGASFDAGQDCGTRVAACLARLSALELIDGSRWWNRRRNRLMARALVACAEDLESAADAASAEAGGRCAPFAPRLTVRNTVLRSV